MDSTMVETHAASEPVTMRQTAPQTDTVRQQQKSQPADVSNRIFDAVITVSIAALMFGVPLFFMPLTMQGIIFDKMVYFYFWALVAVVAWATKSALSGELVLRRTPMDYPILGLLAVMIISAYFSIDRWHSFWGMFGDPSRGVLPLVAFVAVFYVILAHFTWKRFMIFLWALLAAGFVIALWTFLGLLNVPFLPQVAAAKSPLSLMGSLRSLTVFLSAMLPLGIAAMFGLWDSRFAPASRITRNVLTGLIALGSTVILIDLLMLFKFAQPIALLIGTAFFLIYILARIVQPQSSLTIVPMIAFVVVSGALITGVGENGAPLVKVALPDEITPKYSLSWQTAKEAVKDDFFLGSGPATYENAFTMHRPMTFNDDQLFMVRLSQGRGLFFDALATIGVLGTVAAALVFFTFLSVSIFLLSRDVSRNKLYSLGLVSSVLILAINAAMEHTEGSTAILGVLVAALCFGALYHESDLQMPSLRLSLKASPKFALSLAFVSIVLIAGVGMMFFFVGKVFVADIYAGKAAHAQEVNDDTVRSLIKANALYPREERYLARLGQELTVLANREALKPEGERDLGRLRGSLQDAIRIADAARAVSPKSLLAAETYTQVLDNQSFYDPALLDEVLNGYDAVAKLDPHNPMVPAQKGEITVRKAGTLDPEKDKDKRLDILGEARDLFTEAIEKKKNLPVAYYQRALVEQQLGQRDQAIDDMRKAFDLSGRANVTYAFTLGVLYQDRGNDDDMANAESLFRSILGVNDKEINTLFALASLYEKGKHYAEAVENYRKVIELLPEDAKDARANVQRLIDNIEGRGQSIPTDQQQAQNVAPQQAAPQQPATPAQLAAPQQPATPAQNVPASAPQP